MKLSIEFNFTTFKDLIDYGLVDPLQPHLLLSIVISASGPSKDVERLRSDHVYLIWPLNDDLIDYINAVLWRDPKLLRGAKGHDFDLVVENGRRKRKKTQ